MKTTKIRRVVILITSSALVLGLVAIGMASALGNGSPSHPGAQPRSSVPTTVAASPDPVTDRPTTPTRSIAPTVSPAPDPSLLADGVYPTYVRAVDVPRATITIDVLQTLFGADAHRAAIEDGVPWRDVRYDPVYIRNENPLLRTLPVAWDVRILFYGWCDRPNRWAGLTELRKEAASSGEAWYYEMTIVSGDVVRIEQKVAPPGGC